jgi:3-hydroxyisobutyrate dehydrogenase-like beta-hydroxyacid dehydrogenase
MTQRTVCILHPGEMGAAVGRCARAGGARVLWTSAGRSEVTIKRAAAAGLEDAGTLRAALGAADCAIAVCPPHCAVELARSVAAAGFRGLYVDANAIAPATTRGVGEIVEAAGATFVDGGIIGPPPADAGRTRLYLSGPRAEEVAALFAGTALSAVVVVGGIGAASALKMCFAAWNKGSQLLLASVRALAEREGVHAALAEEWRHSQPELAMRLGDAVANARKAWRWIGEMEEIAATFGAAGLPEGFADAGAAICRRLEPFKDARGATIEHVVEALLRDHAPELRRAASPPA